MNNTPKITFASKSSPLIQPSHLLGYGASMNPYVGCGFGCRYCYAMQTVRDPENPWGGFVKSRDFIDSKLPGELWKLEGRSLLIGTMTDPYQPLELQKRLTRSALKILKNSAATGIGIFTQSPHVVLDAELIAMQANPTVHMTIAPVPDFIRTQMEPNSASIRERIAALKMLKTHRIKLDVRLAPVFPTFTSLDNDVRPLYEELVNVGVDSIGVDPYQPFSETNRMLLGTTDGLNAVLYKDMVNKMADKNFRDNWWDQMRESFKVLWGPYASSGVYGYFANHVAYTIENLSTGEVVKLNRKAVPFER